MTTDILTAVFRLASGECRWVGREDIHVYCRRPMVEAIVPLTGRMGWQPGPATYTIVCPAAGLDGTHWTSGPAVVRQIESILAMEAAA